MQIHKPGIQLLVVAFLFLRSIPCRTQTTVTFTASPALLTYIYGGEPPVVSLSGGSTTVTLLDGVGVTAPIGTGTVGGYYFAGSAVGEAPVNTSVTVNGVPMGGSSMGVDWSASVGSSNGSPGGPYPASFSVYGASQINLGDSRYLNIDLSSSGSGTVNVSPTQYITLTAPATVTFFIYDDPVPEISTSGILAIGFGLLFYHTKVRMRSRLSMSSRAHL
jgi:hypothetical protein